MEKLIVYLVFFFYSFLAYSKSGEIDLTYRDNHHSEQLNQNLNYLDYVDKGYDFLTRKVYLLSNTVDAIFTQRSVDESRNKSYFRVWYELSKTEGNDLILRPDFRLRLYLKETRKLLRFTFDNTSRAQDTQSQLSQTQAAASTRNEDKSLSASLGINLKETKKFKLSSGAGIRLGIPPNVFFRSVASFNDSWGDLDVSIQNSIFYYSLDGLGNTSNINFLYPFSKKLRLVFESFSTWLEPSSINAGTGLQLFYSYNVKTTFSAQIGGNANKDVGAFSMRNYFISTAFRQLIYKKWLFLECSPTMSWNRENNWKPSANIYLRLEAFLGGI